MKMNIKIFTVLMLALTTMPGLAEICPTNTPGDTNENCKNKRDIYSSIMKSCAEWIKFNGLDEDIGNCEKEGTRYGHSKATHHKGCCFVFGNDTGSRDPIISLVETYNRNFKRYKAAPEELINEPITFGTVAQLNNWKNNKQPSITALETGYDALCKKNGGNYEFKRQGKTSTYICQGTKTDEKHVQQSTEQKTAQPTQNNTSVSDVNVCENPDQSGKICVYDLTTRKNTPYTFNINAAKNRKKDIKSIVYEYNNIAMQNGFILPIGDIVGIVDKTMKNASAYRNTLEQESSISAVVKGYKILCERNINHNGITSVDFVTKNIGYGYICRAATCNETTYTHDAKKFICVPKPATSRQSAQIHPDQTSSTQQDDTNNDKNITDAIYKDEAKYMMSERQDYEHTFSISAPNMTENIQTAIQDWIKTCQEINDTAKSYIGVASFTGSYEYKNGKIYLKCTPVACKEPEYELKSKSCIKKKNDIIQPSEEERPEHENIEKLKPDDAVLNPVAVNANDIEIKEPIIQPSEEERPEHENIEKLKPDDVALNPVAVNAGDVEIKEPIIQPSEEERPEHENIEKLKPDDVALDPVAVNANDIEIKAPAIQPLQENKCDDQEVEHIIEEMATPRQDPNGNPYIEYSINYKTCDNLQQTWSEKCPDGTRSSITEDGNNIKLTCVPKEDSEVNENNETDFAAIVKAFEERAKQLKAQKCGQQQ